MVRTQVLPIFVVFAVANFAFYQDPLVLRDYRSFGHIFDLSRSYFLLQLAKLERQNEDKA